ncbi:hypothetical protein Q7P37_007338 [Cladosporium fusiforme]
MATPSRLPSTRRPPGAAAGRSRPTSMIEPGFSGLPTPTKTSPKSKRMTMLPQVSRASTAEQKAEQDVGERENMDPDMAQKDGAEDASAESARQADRRAMPPPSKLSRGLSTRVPGTSQIGRAPSVKSHTRTQSVQSGLPSARPEPQRSANSTPAMLAARLAAESGVKRTPSTASASPATRSTGLARTPSVKASQPKTHSRNSSLSTTTPTTGLRRTNSVRPQSIHVPSANQTPIAPAPTSPRKGLDLRPGSRSQLPPSSKPAFSTYQQHYSPAKASLPKPPVPATRQTKPAPNLEEDLSIPFDVAKQQIELLQLSLLHEVSGQTLGQYSDDAKSKLGRKHAKLRQELEAIRATETAQQKLANLAALQAWCPDPSFLAENLQVLARVHKDVVAITHPESRYTELLHAFEDWVASAEGTMSGHTSSFVEPLPGSWREAHASTALKIRSLQRELATLPPAPEQGGEDSLKTSLHVVLNSCRSLVDGILRELDMMQKLEKELLGQESVRINSAVGGLRLDDTSGKAWTPAWQKTS